MAKIAKFGKQFQVADTSVMDSDLRWGLQEVVSAIRAPDEMMMGKNLSEQQLGG